MGQSGRSSFTLPIGWLPLLSRITQVTIAHAPIWEVFLPSSYCFASSSVQNPPDNHCTMHMRQSGRFSFSLPIAWLPLLSKITQVTIVLALICVIFHPSSYWLVSTSVQITQVTIALALVCLIFLPSSYWSASSSAQNHPGNHCACSALGGVLSLFLLVGFLFCPKSPR